MIIKLFSFTDIAIAIVNGKNHCKHFPFITKDQAINICEN